jgi:hypothetical protein
MLRLHALSFQVDLVSGRELLRARETHGDRWLLEKLRAATIEGSARLNQQAMVHVDPLLAYKTDSTHPDPFAGPTPVSNTAEAPAGEATEPEDPFAFSATPNYGASSVGAIREFAYPTEYDENLLPQSTEFKNVGPSFKGTVMAPSASDATNLSVEFDLSDKPVLRAFPPSAEGSIPQISQPFPFTVRASTTIAVTGGSVYLLGAITQQDYDQENRADTPRLNIILLQVTGPSSPSAGKLGAPKEMECELISLEKAEALKLAALLPEPTAANSFLEESLGNKTARPIAFCMAPIPTAGDATISAITEFPRPTEAHWTGNHTLLPDRFEFWNIGTNLNQKALNPAGSAFRHDITATPLQVDIAVLTAAANGDGKITCPINDPSEEFTNFPTTPGLHISAPERIKVPAGHPEEGRWQVTVVRRR